MKRTQSKRTLRELFEAWWKSKNPRDEYNREIWLKRDDIWERGGYAQPTTNWSWRDFRAGYRAAKRRRG